MPLTTYTPGEVLTAASLNNNFTVAAGSGGLVLVQAETAFTASSSVVKDNVFSAAYRNYKIIINYQTSAGDLKMRLRTGGSSLGTSTYNFQEMAASNSSLTAGKTLNAAQWDINYGNVNLNGANEFTIYAPFVATETIFFNAAVRHTTGYNTSGTSVGPIIHNFVGNQTGATSFDGFELFPASGTITGTYAVYGMATS